MPNCEKIGACIFFNDKMGAIPMTCLMYKNTYCQGDFKNCARYIVSTAKGKEGVPGDLFPNQKERALALLQ